MLIITRQEVTFFKYVFVKFLCIVIFCIFVSFKQRICDEDKFESIIISSKCKFNEQVLKDCVSINFFLI
jgi:hypothetical protein